METPPVGWSRPKALDGRGVVNSRRGFCVLRKPLNLIPRDEFLASIEGVRNSDELAFLDELPDTPAVRSERVGDLLDVQVFGFIVHVYLLSHSLKHVRLRVQYVNLGVDF